MCAPAIAPCAEPIGRIEEFIQRGETGYTYSHHAFDLQTNQHRIKGHTFDKGFGPIDWIHDPAEGISLTRAFTVFLSDNRMVWIILLDFTTDEFFGGPICGCDGGLIGFEVMLNSFVVIAKRD